MKFWVEVATDDITVEEPISSGSEMTRGVRVRDNGLKSVKCVDKYSGKVTSLKKFLFLSEIQRGSLEIIDNLRTFIFKTKSRFRKPSTVSK